MTTRKPFATIVRLCRASSRSPKPSAINQARNFFFSFSRRDTTKLARGDGYSFCGREIWPMLQSMINSIKYLKASYRHLISRRFCYFCRSLQFIQTWICKNILAWYHPCRDENVRELPFLPAVGATAAWLVMKLAILRRPACSRLITAIMTIIDLRDAIK